MAKKILVIEDDKTIALALAVRLRAARYAVVVAPDAVLAMSMAVRHRPDLILLDISIPGGNGFMVAEWIQDLETMIDVPMIFISASKQPGLREKARRLGAKGFFEKPYDGEALLATIRDTLEDPIDPDLTEFWGDRVVNALPEVARMPKRLNEQQPISFGVSPQVGLW